MKFVVSSNYYITMDKISSEFYSEIINNEKIVQEWIELGILDEKPSTSDVELLKFATVNLSHLNGDLRKKY